jgi:hypothetical protein
MRFSVCLTSVGGVLLSVAFCSTSQHSFIFSAAGISVQLSQYVHFLSPPPPKFLSPSSLTNVVKLHFFFFFAS